MRAAHRAMSSSPMRLTLLFLLSTVLHHLHGSEAAPFRSSSSANQITRRGPAAGRRKICGAELRELLSTLCTSFRGKREASAEMHLNYITPYHMNPDYTINQRQLEKRSGEDSYSSQWENVKVSPYRKRPKNLLGFVSAALDSAGSASGGSGTLEDRGVAHACCENMCSLPTLLSYCSTQDGTASPSGRLRQLVGSRSRSQTELSTSELNDANSEAVGRPRSSLPPPVSTVQSLGSTVSYNPYGRNIFIVGMNRLAAEELGYYDYDNTH